ncbi:MAG: M43 family zinc metalloprotease [Bacteroidota bacterium]|nr:M43 family zinc metalloprotease [Bacteroidota bacterium]
MKKQLSFITIGITMLSTTLSYSQQIQPCVTVDAMNQYFVANPQAKIDYEKKQAKFEVDYQAAMLNKAQNKTAAVQYTIPVVFHILHTGGSENITDAQCSAALAQVNSDFAAAGADFNSIYADFKALYINSDIKFMLAKKDPSGNCTTGIEHIYDTRTVWDRNPAGAFSYLYNGITWDPMKYLNIIIVKDIVAASGQNGTVIGYTYLPGTWGTSAVQDAIVYNYSFLSGLNARSLSHEIGHWLNLSHTFGNTNNPGVTCGSTSGGDGVSDTPDTKGNFSTCPATNTNSAILCTSGNSSYYQNVENFMDYSSCPKNFTTGQTTRMRTALASSTSGRNNLWSTGNLTSTDVNGTGLCAPVSSFLSTTGYTVCSGGSLTMKDFSYNGTISGYTWTANNGATPASPNASITSVTFPTIGTVTISLTVNNIQGSSTSTKTVSVVNGAAVINGGANMESFETLGVIPSTWSVIDATGSAKWAQTPIAGIDGNSSVMLDGTQSAAGETDILQMPMMDVVNNPSSVFSFKYAYARKTSTQADVLKLQGSKDCGGTWSDIYTFSAGTMANGSGGINSTPWAPSNTEWKTYNVTYDAANWFNFQNSASVLVRFTFIEDPASGNGNRLFLDAINVVDTAAVGINELTKSIHFNMYPNPTSGVTTIKFNLNDAAAIKVNVVDLLGKEVLPVTNSIYNAGEQTISINNNGSLSKGIYFINLTLNGTKMSKKLVIQ